ncbi:MAG: helix-turn-helix domain-containing protein [Anaerolineales bacterium]
MPRTPQQDNVYVQRINTVLNYVRENLTDDLSLNTLARVAGFSPFHFHRLFKSLTDETVNECVNRLRLERATMLLKTSGISITQAALECGFESVSGFW